MEKKIKEEKLILNLVAKKKQAQVQKEEREKEEYFRNRALQAQEEVKSDPDAGTYLQILENKD